jgi:hypothetical protein
MQPLLGIAASPFLAPARLYALGAIGLVFVGGIGWAAHEHGVAQHARAWEKDNKLLRAEAATWSQRTNALRVQVQTQHVECVQDQLQSAEMHAKQDQRARTASLSARARIRHATEQTAPSTFDLSAALDGLRKPAGDTPAAAPAGSPGAGDVAVSLPSPPNANAVTP